MKTNRILLILSALLLASCSSPSVAPSSSASPSGTSASEPEGSSYPDAPIKDLPVKQRTFYQLLVYSFADGNGDGIGDFKGIIDNLDYLEGLGVGGIWLSPILKAASYHAYDVVDYYAVNPTYEPTVSGVKYDLAKLLEACHEKGIKVILDMVLNHSHSSCAWVREHGDWYKTPDAFPGSMKDFNYDNQALRAEIKNVGKYWLAKGVDGFRLDAAKWIYNYGGTNDGADDAKNYAWWNEFYKACQETNPDVYMVGEVLVENNLRDDRSYYRTGMDSNFNFELRDAVSRALNGYPSAYTAHLSAFQGDIRAVNGKAIEASCLSNHDIGRFNQIKGLSAEKTALAGMMNLLAPGDSYLYYGEELGLTGSTEDGYADMAYRTPMPFSSGRTDSVAYFQGFKGNGRSISRTLSGRSAKEDLADPSSLANDFGDAIKAKNRAKTLYSGAVKENPTSADAELASFITTLGSDANTVYFNCGPNAKTLEFETSGKLIGESAYGDRHSGYSGSSFYLAPYSSAIFEGEVKLKGSTPIDASSSSSSAASSSSSGLTPDDPGSEVTAEKQGQLTLHCKAVEGWDAISCYAWVGSNQYLGAWPGSSMAKEGDWYTVSIPHGASNVIFNSPSSGKQTINLARPNEGEYWFVPSGSEDKLGGDWHRQNPSL